MTNSERRVGLLLDVDGPISNPDAKRIIDPHIVPALIELHDAGNPIVFNTGRSADFVREVIFPPMLAAANGPLHHVHSVCEKGGVWISAANDDEPQVDPALQVPRELDDVFKKLVDAEFSDTMFFDDTELTMVSIERNPHTSHDEYMAAQQPFVDTAMKLLGELGYGVRLRGQDHPNASGEVTLKVDPSIIAVDIEHVDTGKDVGARRAFELIRQDMDLPNEWRTYGDSPGDYAMARWLHEGGYEVKHLDVRPDSEGNHPFDVVYARESLNDEAGSLHLRWLLDYVNGGELPEIDFEKRR